MSDMNNYHFPKKTVLLVSNSSWYLNHYRKLLIETLLKENLNVVSLSPFDSSTSKLKNLSSIHITCSSLRGNNFNPFNLIKSFLEILISTKEINPKIIHSHTMKANLFIAIISSIFGIKTIFSFAGFGILSKRKGLNRLIFILVIKFIGYLSSIERSKGFKWIKNYERVKFIFQNSNDMAFFEQNVKFVPKNNNNLILGSGVPMHYFNKNNINNFQEYNWFKENINKTSRIEFIFCARLLKSKGILIFKDLAKFLRNHKFTVFGNVDPANNDSITNQDILFFESESKNLEFKGNLKDPLKNYKFKGLPILVVPSNYGEGVSRSIVEGLSQGIPTICSKSVSSKLFNESYLYISSSNDVKSYIICYENILKDSLDHELNNKINNGIKISKEFFSEEVIVKKTLEIYMLLDNIKHD